MRTPKRQFLINKNAKPTQYPLHLNLLWADPGSAQQGIWHNTACVNIREHGNLFHKEFTRTGAELEPEDFPDPVTVNRAAMITVSGAIRPRSNWASSRSPWIPLGCENAEQSNATPSEHEPRVRTHADHLAMLPGDIVSMMILSK